MYNSHYFSFIVISEGVQYVSDGYYVEQCLLFRYPTLPRYYSLITIMIERKSLKLFENARNQPRP